MIFRKDEVAQNNDNFLGYFLFKLNKQFKNMVCCRHFKVLKVV
jgi:hypothetical protein